MYEKTQTTETESKMIISETTLATSLNYYYLDFPSVYYI